MHSDARRFRRFKVKVPLYVTVGEQAFNKLVEIESRDVSSGGICFETSRRLPIQGQSRIFISKLGDLPVMAQIEGRVVYVRRAPNGRFEVGVEFTDFTNLSREELIERIEAWERSQQSAADSP